MGSSTSTVNLNLKKVAIWNRYIILYKNTLKTKKLVCLKVVKSRQTDRFFLIIGWLCDFYMNNTKPFRILVL